MSKNVFDLDSMGLIRMVKDLRDEKKFQCGDEMDVAPKFYIGCAENPWLPAAQQCVSQKCNATCGGLLGGTCGTDTWLPGSQACRDCADANCCGPYGACTADDTCLACLLDPAGCVPNALRDAVDACLDAACAASCG